MRPEDAAQFAQMKDTLAGAFPVPREPATTIPLVLAALAALAPIGDTLRDPQLVGAEWLTPGLLDAFERVGGALGELYDELESALDEVVIHEPGTIGQQNLVDLPSRGHPGAPATRDAIPRPAGAPRGELIR